MVWAVSMRFPCRVSDCGGSISLLKYLFFFLYFGIHPWEPVLVAMGGLAIHVFDVEAGHVF